MNGRRRAMRPPLPGFCSYSQCVSAASGYPGHALVRRAGFLNGSFSLVFNRALSPKLHECDTPDGMVLLSTPILVEWSCLKRTTDNCMWKDVPTENMPFAARARNERARSNRHSAKPSNGRRNSVRRRRRWSSASARQMSATRTSGGRPDAASGLQTNEGGRHAGRLPSLILAGDL
jgi:hypothetical protein